MINTKILKEELGMRLVKIVDMELRKSDKTFLLDVKLDAGNTYAYVRNIVVGHIDKIIDKVDIELSICNNVKISGLFPNDLLIDGDVDSVTIEQKPKEMTLEDIEKALGYPIKIMKEKITGTTILLIVMWIVCTAISITGMICKRNIDVVSIMSIP